MKSILDPTFKYVPAANTDLKRTFARIRREQQSEADRLRELEPVVVEIKTIRTRKDIRR